MNNEELMPEKGIFSCEPDFVYSTMTFNFEFV